MIIFRLQLINLTYAAKIGDSFKRNGMVLPFKPLSITFENIRFSVDMPKVIQDISSFLLFIISSKIKFLQIYGLNNGWCREY